MVEVEADEEVVSDADEADAKPGVAGHVGPSSESESILDQEYWYLERVRAEMMVFRKRKEEEGSRWIGWEGKLAAAAGVLRSSFQG